MDHTSTDERRSAPRTSVNLWVDEQTEGVVYFQRATNLSLEGMYLSSTLPHPAGTELTLELQLGDREPPLRVKGLVVAAMDRELGMGVRFTELSPEAHERLTRLLAARAS